MSVSKKINYTEYYTDDIFSAEKANEIQLCIKADETAIESVETRVEAVENKIQTTTSYTKDEIDNKLLGKVDKENDKGLSTNDYTDLDKAEVEKVKDKQDKLIFDIEPTEDSPNSVTSGAVASAIKKATSTTTSYSKQEIDDKLLEKQDILEFDVAPVDGSEKMLKSGTIYTAFDNKVDKVDNKGLSTNDYTDEEKLKVAEIDNKVDKETNKGLSTNDYTNEDKAEVTKVKDKQDKLTFDAEPTESSDNPVTSGGLYITVNGINAKIDKKANSATTLAEYGIEDAYTKDEINSKIVGVYKICGSKIVAEINALETSTLTVGDVYNVSDSGTIPTDIKVNAGDNIVWTTDGWDNLSGIIDLSNYQTKLTFDVEPIDGSKNPVESEGLYNKFSTIDLNLEKKVDKIDGKGLSTNDYTDLDKVEVEKVKDKQDKLIFDTAPADGSTNVVSSGVVYTQLNTKVDKEVDKGLSTNDYTNEDKAKVAEVDNKQDKLTFDDAPTADSENVLKSGVVKVALDTKVDKVENKGLSTNDYTTEDKDEVAKIKDKQDKLVFDDTPTADSSNIVNSGVVKTALDTKQDTLVFDAEPTKDSTNVVSSGAIATALEALSGTTSYTKDEVDLKLEDKVDKVDGMGLSTNDYTDEEKTDVAKIKTLEEEVTKKSFYSLVTNNESFTVTVKRGNKNWIGYFVFSFVNADNTFYSIVVHIHPTYMKYTMLHGNPDTLSTIKYTIDDTGTEITFSIDFSQRVYGSFGIEIPEKFGQVTQFVGGKFEGTNEATKNDVQIFKQGSGEKAAILSNVNTNTVLNNNSLVIGNGNKGALYGQKVISKTINKDDYTSTIGLNSVAGIQVGGFAVVYKKQSDGSFKRSSSSIVMSKILAVDTSAKTIKIKELDGSVAVGDMLVISFATEFDDGYSIVYDTTLSNGQNNMLGANRVFANGINNKVTGGGSIATGAGNFVFGENSFVVGNSNGVSGSNCLVSGTNNYILNSGSFAVGTNNETNEKAFLIGDNLQSGAIGQCVFGRYNEWDGSSIVVFGTGNNDSSRQNSMAVVYGGVWAKNLRVNGTSFNTGSRVLDINTDDAYYAWVIEKITARLKELDSKTETYTRTDYENSKS